MKHAIIVNGIDIEHSYEWSTFLAPLVSAEFHPPGRALAPVPLAPPGVTITPVTVSHYSADRCSSNGEMTCYACAAFVVQTAETKVVLLWDIDNDNEWLDE